MLTARHAAAPRMMVRFIPPPRFFVAVIQIYSWLLLHPKTVPGHVETASFLEFVQRVLLGSNFSLQQSHGAIGLILYLVGGDDPRRHREKILITLLDHNQGRREFHLEPGGEPRIFPRVDFLHRPTGLVGKPFQDACLFVAVAAIRSLEIEQGEILPIVSQDTLPFLIDPGDPGQVAGGGGTDRDVLYFFTYSKTARNLAG